MEILAVKKEERRQLAEYRSYLEYQKIKLLPRLSTATSIGFKQLLRTFDMYNEEIEKINKSLRDRLV